MVQLSENALSIFKSLYSKNGETVEDTFRRAAKCVSKNQEEEDLAVKLQVDNIIRYNTPCYFNSGGKTNLFSACWVVPLTDSMEGIYLVANVARKIFAYGSGIGIPIGNLREKDAPIFDGDNTTAPCGQSSGPITFMKLYDAVAATTKSGGRARRAAILCAMQVWHPDILDFIQAKEIDGSLSNMNLSVTITDKFMECLKNNIPFPLHTPYDGSFVRNEDSGLIWDTICKQAHKTGDPGVIFIDTVNKFNPLIAELLIETPNPCLIADTVVETDMGDLTIGELIQKDFQSYKIRGFSDEKNEYCFDVILDVKATKFNTKIIRLVFDHALYVDCTPDHRFFTKNRGYQPASEITIEDLLVSSKYGLVKLTEIIELEDPANVYDITTEKNHNFFANGILVHNCGEVPMPPWLSCNLAMINVAKFINKDGTYNWDGLFKTSYDLCSMMNNMIDVMDFPDDNFKENTLKYRPMGIGPAGLSDAMFLLGLKYNGKDGKDFAEEVMRTITHGAVRRSIELAKERGPFYNYVKHKENIERIIIGLIESEGDEEVEKTIELLKEHGTINSTNTVCAPTGTTALSCDTSYGIEPCFGLVYEKTLITGQKMKMVNPIFEQKYKDEPWFTSDLIERIFINGGSLKNVRGIPKDIREVFVVAHDIKPKDRIEIQGHIQKRISLAISSCITIDSLLTTDSGLFYLDELYNVESIKIDSFKNDHLCDKHVLNHLDKFVDITSFYNNGVKPTFTILLENDLILTSTLNEKVLVLNEEQDFCNWKQINDIEIGDRVKIA